MMSSNNIPRPGATHAPVPCAPQTASGSEGTPTDLGILETLAELPVAEHLAIYEELHTQLSADLGTTSQEQW
ncbi:hypothetical protein CQ018_16775 [Arthrobacter sp. MYb227]|uniref:hypothetical protein n=1 Tax=Arthrobacter sp. MYb227 TaxID=1848601 RepID=UPI000D49ADCE|nr:hypothetical protein [Arthrobacter sp. MYb227]PQZ88640.1 hypothetical protein CQ018_16775 [Arthrobacter sp. MYb227]